MTCFVSKYVKVIYIGSICRDIRKSVSSSQVLSQVSFTLWDYANAMCMFSIRLIQIAPADN